MNEGVKVLEDKLVYLDEAIKNLQGQADSAKVVWENVIGHLSDHKQKRAEVDLALMKLKMHEGEWR